jgi:hypothetical protein
MLSSWPAPALVFAVSWLTAAAPLAAQEIFLEIDPVRSQITLGPGSQSILPLSQNFSGFGFGDQVLPHTAQPGLPPGQLPNGSPSDGRTTALGGLLRVDVGDLEAPTQVDFVGESSSIRLLTSGNWRPGAPPALATDVAPAALAVRFDNAALAVATEAAFRTAALGVATTSAAALTATGPDAWSFAAGCASATAGCPELRFEEAILDAAVDGGVVLRSGFRSPTSFRNPAGTQGTLTRTALGELELTLPIDVTVPITAADLNDPFGTTHTLLLSGQLVAVPEPSSARLGIGALLALAALAAASKRARRRRVPGITDRSRSAAAQIRVAALALVAGFGTTGCELLFDEMLDEPSFYSLECRYEFLAVRKFNGMEQIFADPENQPCNVLGRSFNGNSGGVDFTLLAKIAYQSGQRYAKTEITMDPVSNLSVDAEIDYRVGLRYNYGPSLRGDLTQLYFGGSATSLGTARGETATGWVDIGGMVYPLDGMLRYRDLDPAGGSVDLTFGLESLRRAAGKGYQGAALQIGIRPNACSDNRQCERTNPATPFCARNGITSFCTDGRVGAPCSHASQCESNLSCSNGFCEKLGLRFRFDF